MTFVKVAVAFVGKGSLAVEKRPFGAVKAELYCCWACGGLYELSCRGSLALVKGEGKASKAYAGGACADGACVDKACADKACVGGAYADRACVDGAWADGAYISRRSFKTARAKARAADDVKGVDERDLRQ